MSATMIRGLLAVGIAAVGVLGLVGPGQETGAASSGAPGTATTVYVAPDGSETGSGSVADPYATFQQAVDALGPDGGRVLARGGTYQDQRILLQAPAPRHDRGVPGRAAGARRLGAGSPRR